MFIQLKLSLALAVVVIGMIVGQTQNYQAMIEDSIKSKESIWELSKKEVLPKSTIYRWKSGGYWVDMNVFVTPSEKAAKEKLHEAAMKVPVPPTEKLVGLGDEVFLYQGAKSPSYMLLYRKAEVFVQVNSNSLDHAKRFAQHVDELFPK
jgi:hypothetical protein